MREISYSKDARKQLLAGVEIIAKAVKTTLGPSGRNVLIRNKEEKRPFSTKDGVTVAWQVASSNPIEQIAIESLQDIANITDEGAGDGTTTATVLAEAILKEGLRDIDDFNLFDIKRGIEEASRILVEMIAKHSIDIKDDPEKLQEVALISSNYDEEISKVVYEAFKIAGRQGIVNIKRSRTFDTYVKSIKGMTLPVGYISRFYATSADDTCVLEKPWVFMTNKKINKIEPNFELMLSTIAERGDHLLIMCAGLDPVVSEMFIRNVQQGTIRLCVTKNAGFGNEQEDLLRDLGVVLGKEPFLENEGIDFEDIPQDNIFDHISRSKEVTVTEHNISFMEPYFVEDAKEKSEAIEKAKEERAEKLREEVFHTQTQYEKGNLQTRISRLADGIAFINIGSRSETEFKEKQARIQDALYAVKAANEEGIIPGGGAFLYSLSHLLEFDSYSGNKSILRGVEIIREAIKKPLLQIVENVGDKLTEDQLLEIASTIETGYDAVSKKIVPDMVKAKIIDPAKVTRVALESAVSVASMVLTTECAIVDTDVYDKQSNQY